jgi:hypothetical protein
MFSLIKITIYWCNYNDVRPVSEKGIAIHTARIHHLDSRSGMSSRRGYMVHCEILSVEDLVCREIMVGCLLETISESSVKQLMERASPRRSRRCNSIGR